MANKLPLVRVLVGSVLIPWHYREKFLQALTFPLCVMVVLSVGWQYGAEYVEYGASWLLYFLSCIVAVAVAVPCHRLVLLGGTSRASRIRPEWGRRETLFLLWTLVTAVIVTLVETIVGTVLLNLPGPWHPYLSGQSSPWAMFLAKMVGLYILGRLCLVFPAVAVNRAPNLKWTWRETKGNGSRLFIIVAVAPCTISYAMGLLYREAATSIETVTLTVLGAVVFVLEIVAVSLSYQSLVEKGPPTEA